MQFSAVMAILFLDCPAGCWQPGECLVTFPWWAVSTVGISQWPKGLPWNHLLRGACLQ